MKKLLLLLFLLIVPSVLAASYSTNITYFSNNSVTDSIEGVVWANTQAVQLAGISQNPLSTAQTCAVIDHASNVTLAQGAFAGTFCPIYVTLVPGLYYRMVANFTGTRRDTNNGTVQVNPTLPINYPARGNFTGGCFSNAAGNCNNYVFNGTMYNIDNITLNDTRSPDLDFFANFTTFETLREGFRSNYSWDGANPISSALLNYNGVTSAATVGALDDATAIFTAGLDIPVGSNGGLWFWTVNFQNGSQLNTSYHGQSITPITLSECKASPQNVQYINFTFKNETAAQQAVNASVSSTWNYYLGSGAVNKTLSYVNASLNPSYAFCFSPASATLKTSTAFSYSNTESLQRTYSPTLLTLTNTTTNTVLYLLPISLGQPVSFQVKNVGGQLISGATITASTSTFGLVESHVTDASGLATFFLNPLTSYTITASAAGYSPLTTTITPSQTTYTITLGATSSGTLPNYAQGVSIAIQPSSGITLQNNSVYHFNMTINSTTWTFSSFGFVLSNGTFDFKTITGAGGTSGFADTTLDTGLNKTIVMRYFYVVNNTPINYTAQWYVVNTALSSYSLAALGSAMATDLSLGLFGADKVSTGFIVFIIIFISTGIFSFKYGVTSPASLVGFVTALVGLLDIGFNLIPNPVDAVSHFPTIFMVVITIGLMLKGATE